MAVTADNVTPKIIREANLKAVSLYRVKTVDLNDDALNEPVLKPEEMAIATNGTVT
jgi:hypothetical protein